MGQVKIYGKRAPLQKHRLELSQAIHSCLVDAFQVPPEKKFQRFIPLDPDDFIHPSDRSDRYTIIEISIFEGRSDGAKRKLIELLFARCEEQLNLPPQDLEITLFETPRLNWGIRGKNAADLSLGYAVEV